MAGESPLDLKKFLEKSTAKTSLTDLQKKGVQNVRVLDQRTLERLIADAVQKAISGRSGLLTTEERQRIEQEAKRELDTLMREFNHIKKLSESATQDRNTLLNELENLQKQLRVTRTMYDEKVRVLEDRVRQGGDPAQAQQTAQQIQQLQAQNSYLEARGREMEEKLREASGGSPAELKEAFNEGVRSQEPFITELKGRIAELQNELQQARQQQQAVVQEGALSNRLEELAARDDALADRISKIFAKTVEGLNRKIASIKAGAGATDEVEYRASEQVLDNLLKAEIESNLGNVAAEQQKVESKGSMDDRLSKLKAIQAGFKPKRGEEKKEGT